ncbi:hypothetical protein QQS21_008575 [Conoideocrella luteorostrata]|uniref:Enterotoxin n=1 Tax=Conoideocrella luteorostrata TaxID=1105319 RepID=A0AAJ0CIW5_9HYPO|nr:hypothetical protein QQS21_008575 [Conoideocrella luteorostrata]
MYAFLALVFSALLICSGHAGRGDNEPALHTVVLSDTRRPAKIRAEGGFLSSAKNLTQANLYEYSLSSECPSPVNCSRELFYLRTSKNLLKEEQRLGDSPGFVYHIQATPNFIDLQKTLEKHPNKGREDEVAVFGDIRWSQVISWVAMPQGKNTDLKDKKRTNNIDFEPGLKSFSTSSYDYQLYVIPGSNTQTTMEETNNAAIEFMSGCTVALGWVSLFEPSIKNTLKQIKKASRKAVRASTDAKDLDAPSSGTLARLSRKEADLAMNLTMKLAADVNSFIYPHLQVVTTSYELALPARRSAMKAMRDSEIKFAEEYLLRVQRAKLYALERNPGALVEATGTAAVTSLAQSLVNRAIDELWHVKEREQKLKAAHASVPPNDFVCVRMLEDCELAKQRELEAIKEDIHFLSETIRVLGQTSIRIKKESDEALVIALSQHNHDKEEAPAPSQAAKKAKNSKGITKAVENIMAVESVAPVLNETQNLVATVKKVDHMGNVEQELVYDIMGYIAELGLHLISLIPSPWTGPLQLLFWARRAYRFYLVARKLNMVLKVGRVGNDLVKISATMAELSAKTADTLQRTDRPPPLAAARMANMNKNSTSTFFGVFRDLDSQRVGPNWKHELEVRSGLQVVDGGSSPDGIDVKKSPEGSTAQALTRIKEMLESAKGEKDRERGEESADTALEAFEEAITGNSVREKTLLDTLDEEIKAGRIKVPDQPQSGMVDATE